MRNSFAQLKTELNNLAAHGNAVKEVTLQKNYRSTGKILNVATTMVTGIQNRVEKSLETTRGQGEDIQIWQ
eukprot:scaffold648860_cov37-Prasinocladus_malaysianus.AAC.1